MKQDIYSSPVIDFITVSVEYCALVEQLQAKTVSQLLDNVSKLLPLIYVKASLLPAIEGEGLQLPEIVQEDDYNFVRQGVWNLLRDKDEYLDVFTPDMQFSESPVTCSISEDLADIYQDLKNFVAIYADRNEMLMADAVETVRDNFRNYWGQKLVNCMRPIHDLIYNQALNSEDTDDTIED